MNLRKAAVIGLPALAVLVWLLTLVPADVPDTSSPPDANHAGVINSANSIGQTFVPNRNGLDRIDVGLAVEHPTDVELTFQVSEVPWKQQRTVKLNLSDVPRGRVIDFRPGSITEHWYSFSFEPVPDSAGKNMYFSLEGKEIQGPNSAGLLMFFHNNYPPGEAYLNGEALNANVVFRAYARGNLLALGQVVLQNWSSQMPAPVGYPAVVGGLALLFAGLAATTLRLLIGHPSNSSPPIYQDSKIT